jgi:hypothetical protein
MRGEVSDDYAQYLEYCVTHGIDEKLRLTPEQWDVDYDHDMDVDETLKLLQNGFIPKVIAGKAAQMGVDWATERIKAKALREGINPELAVDSINGMFRTASKLAGDTFRPIKAEKGSSPNAPNNGGGNSNSGGKSGNNSNLNTLPNHNPTPTKIILSTPVSANCYPDYYMDSTSFDQSDLQISGASLSVLGMADQVSSFFSNVLMTEFLVTVQQNVRFRIDLSVLGDPIVMIAYLENLIKALNHVYFSTSLMQYTASGGRNKGMLELRNAMSATDIEKLYELIRVLDTLPIPPRLNEMVWYLNQNYKSSELAGSSLLKMIPFSFGATSAAEFPSETLMVQSSFNIQSIITELTNTTNRKVASILGTAAPNWAKINVMGPSPSVDYSPNFLTIWANLPLTSNGHNRPTVTDRDQTINYKSYADPIDGFAYSLVHIEMNNVVYPGLLARVDSFVGNTISCNRFSYLSDQGSVFDPVWTGQSLSLMRGESYAILGLGSSIATHPFGSQNLNGVSINTVLTSAVQSIEWLFGVDTISAADSYNNKGRSSSNDGGAKKKRGRGKRIPNSTDIIDNTL